MAFSAQLTSDRQVAAIPNKPITLSLTVINMTDRERTARIAVTPPEDWSWVAVPEDVVVPPGESQVAFIILNLPSLTPSGTYGVAIRAESADGREMLAEEVSISLAEIREIELRSEGGVQGGFYAAGDEGLFNFQLLNKGNVSVTADLAAAVMPEWEATVTPASATIDPGESTRIAVSVNIPADLGKSEMLRVELSAITTDTSAEAPLATERSTAQVAGRSTPVSRETMYSRLKGTTTTSAEWEEDEPVLVQQELELGGDLGNERRMSLHAVSPALTGDTSGTLSQDATFNLHYEDYSHGITPEPPPRERTMGAYLRGTDDWGCIDGLNFDPQAPLFKGFYVDIGDEGVSLPNRLAGNNISGRGVTAGVRYGPHEYAVFLKEPYQNNTRRYYGASGSMLLDDAIQIHTVALKREDDGAGTSSLSTNREDCTVVSLLTEIVPDDRVDISLEAAATDDQYEGYGQAWQAIARYSGENLTYGGEYVYSGTDFLGGWRDTEYRRVDCAWTPDPRLRLSSSYNLRETNVRNDPAESAARDAAWRADMRLDLDRDTQLKVNFNSGRRRDRLNGEQGTRSTSTDYTLTHDWEAFRLSLGFEDSNRRDLDTDSRDDSEGYSLEGRWQLAGGSNIAFDYSLDTSRDESGERSDTDKYKLSTGIRLDPDSRLQLSYRRSLSDRSGGTTTLDGEYSTEFSNRHQLSLRVQHDTGVYGDDTNATLEYTVPVGLAATPFPVRGIVTGRIVLAHDPDRGIPGVLVKLDRNEILTGDGGCFSFPAVAPGEHQFQINTATLELGMSADPLAATWTIDGVAPQPAPCEIRYDDLPREERSQLPGLAALGHARHLQRNWPVTVEVEAGRLTEITVPVRSSSRISGKVVRLVQARPGAETTEEPYGTVVIELTRMGQTLYRVTDVGGHYAFTGLEPGTYNVRLRTERLPEYHEVVPADYSVELELDQQIDGLDFEARPVEREIEITQF